GTGLSNHAIGVDLFVITTAHMLMAPVIRYPLHKRQHLRRGGDEAGVGASRLFVHLSEGTSDRCAVGRFDLAPVKAVLPTDVCFPRSRRVLAGHGVLPCRDAKTIREAMS